MLLLVLFRLGNREVVSTPICDLQAAVAPYCELQGIIAASDALTTIATSLITAEIACRSIHISGGGNGQTPVPYAAKAVHFDGSVLISGATFAVDSPRGLLSVWSKSNNGITFIHKPDSGNFGIALTGSGTVYLNGTFYDASNNNYWNHQTLGFAQSVAWINTLVSWDMNYAAGSRIVQVYISDIPIDNVPNGVGDAFSVDLTTGQTFVFRDTITFYDSIIADVADFYFDTAFMDLSIEANRRKFITADGKPVDLGANGETPTGSTPQIFFSGDAEEFLTNKGSGPSFTYTGVLTDAATSPSD